jgi:hypothetical protein
MSGRSGAQVEVTAPARLRRMGENEAWEGGGKVSEGEDQCRGKNRIGEEEKN